MSILRILYNIITVVLWFSLAIIMLVFSLFVTYAYICYKDLPDHTNLNTDVLNISTKLFDSSGYKMSEYGSERKIFLKIDQIPAKIINAFLAAEDENFFKHQGIEIGSIIRAFLYNMMNIFNDKRAQGGSTITQQVIKNLLLKDRSVSLKRKCKEIILALRLEQNMTKKQILELYLNHVYCGSDMYGVGSAAYFYFQTKPDDLDVAQCSYIAGLAKGANNYKDLEKASARRNWVIDRQEKLGFITQEESHKFKQEPLSVIKYTPERYAHGYYTRKIYDIMTKDLKIDPYQQELYIYCNRDKNLQIIAKKALRKGLHIYDRQRGWRGPVGHYAITDSAVKSLAKHKPSQLPSNAQCAIISSVHQAGIEITLRDDTKHTISNTNMKWVVNSNKKTKYTFRVGDIITVKYSQKKKSYVIVQMPIVQGAIVIMDSKNGNVLAMQGGYSYKYSKSNRAEIARQPGSTVKAFIYSCALENNIDLDSIISGASIIIESDNNKTLWQPKNYPNKQYGDMKIKDGLIDSVNTVTVRLSQMIGLKNIIEFLQRIKLYDKLPYYPSLVLGSIETTPLKLATAISIIVNEGYSITPKFIAKIQDRDGQVIYQNADASYITTYPGSEKPPKISHVHTQVIDKEHAIKMKTLLKEVARHGTAKRLRSLNMNIGGKTGTTNDSKDVWFGGFIDDIVITVFVGYDKPKSLGNDETGSNIPLTIFIKCAQEIKKMHDKKNTLAKKDEKNESIEQIIQELT